MSRFLRDLLNAEEPLFSLSLKQLESASGHHGEDARLVGEIHEKTAERIRSLGLDPADTTPREMYAALLNKIKTDNARVAKLIGGTDPDDIQHMIPLMIAAVKKLKINRTAWVLKRSVAKNLLKSMPPKKLMAHLGYKSIDSMLKHENIDEIYTALRFSEGADWLNKYNELFKTIRPGDFESREISFVVMDHKKYVDLAEGFVKKKLHNITHTKEMGVIVVVPMHHKKMTGITLKSLPLLLHYINEIRLYSAFFKLKQVKQDFGRVVVETLIADPGKASSMAGNHVHWRVIQRYFGKLADENHPEAFEPHVQPEDLHWDHATKMLLKIDPEMAFWDETDYVARLDSQDNLPISFNLMDVSFSYSNSETYQNRLFYHFRESLWNEIFIRYMGHKNLEDQILKQLDNDMVAPEKLQPPKLSPKEKSADKRRRDNILMRQRLIDAAEGRLIGVSQEFKKAFDILEKYPKAVTIFGSARLSQDDPFFKAAYDLAVRLAGKGYAIVTGGGYGIMEAANRGTFEAGGDSIGFNINLPTEQKLNNYTTEHYQFEHFFGRKVSMTLQMSAYVYFPGGFGTLDELFEIMTLEQTGKIPRVPIVLYGSEFWQPLLKFIDQTLNKKFSTIHQDDEKLLALSDDLDQIVKLIEAHQNDANKPPKGARPHAKN